MPRLWSDTLEEHRRDVRTAILDTTWNLVTEHGLLSVTMARIAEQTGIGRATLYKYFPNVEAILVAFHERHVEAHLEELTGLRDHAADPAEALHAVLRAYARLCFFREQHGTGELAALVHRGEPVQRAQEKILDLLRDCLSEVRASGGMRGDVDVDELAGYCLHALAAAGGLSSEAAVDRLVVITEAGLAGPG